VLDHCRSPTNAFTGNNSPKLWINSKDPESYRTSSHVGGREKKKKKVKRKMKLIIDFIGAKQQHLKTLKA